MHETGHSKLDQLKVGPSPVPTERDGMGREVGGGFRMGAHVHPWLIHVNVWQKPPQYLKE